MTTASVAGFGGESGPDQEDAPIGPALPPDGLDPSGGKARPISRPPNQLPFSSITTE